ncbi:MAG: hypothetical protein Q8Q33_09320, partial [Chlamydiota bacterium]|nr:hypothetical protein [Chlamydiota bacterium]
IILIAIGTCLLVFLFFLKRLRQRRVIRKKNPTKDLDKRSNYALTAYENLIAAKTRLIKGEKSDFYRDIITLINRYLTDLHNLREQKFNTQTLKSFGVDLELILLYEEVIAMGQKISYGGYKTYKEEDEYLMRKIGKYFQKQSIVTTNT